MLVGSRPPGVVTCVAPVIPPTLSGALRGPSRGLARLAGGLLLPYWFRRLGRRYGRGLRLVVH